jgi:hypothetical protein
VCEERRGVCLSRVLTPFRKIENSMKKRRVGARLGGIRQPQVRLRLPWFDLRQIACKLLTLPHGTWYLAGG